MFKNYEGFVIKYKYERIVIGPTVDTEGGGGEGRARGIILTNTPPPSLVSSFNNSIITYHITENN